jgi:hypothetical protein
MKETLFAFVLLQFGQLIKTWSAWSECFAQWGNKQRSD